MIINGKDRKFAYTVGAWCDINDYVVANPDVSAATANIHKAVIMNKAFNEANGIDDDLTVDELRKLPASIMFEVLDEIKKAEDEGSLRTVETEEKKPANAEKK